MTGSVFPPDLLRRRSRHGLGKSDVGEADRFRSGSRVDAIVCRPENVFHRQPVALVVTQRIAQVVEHDPPQADVFPHRPVNVKLSVHCAGSISGGARSAGQPNALRAHSSCNTACDSAI